MDAIALGPALISVERLYAFAAALLMLGEFSLLIHLLKRAHPVTTPDTASSRYALSQHALSQHTSGSTLSASAASWFNRVLLGWLIGARLTHVALYQESYQQAPLDILKLWQPGYHLLGGVLLAIIVSLWQLRRQGRLAQVIGLGSLTLGLTAFIGLKQLDPLGNASAIDDIPAIALEHINGNTVALDGIHDERVIINLWATWCPPCRREMPLLAEADTRQGVTVVLANQGEQPLAVTRFLKSARLSVDYPLLDPEMQLMGLAKAQGLPATLVFDADGHLIARHIGELSRAQLQEWLPE